MKQFEYLVKESYPEEFELNELGAQGWELIHITESRYIYKREKQREELGDWSGDIEELPQGTNLNDKLKDTITKVLEETKWDKRRAAQMMGISEWTLNRKIKVYGLKK